MTQEKFYPIKGYEGLYEISINGKIKSIGRKIEKILKPSINSRGYLCVNLTKDKKMKTIKLHRIISNAFIPNPLNKPQVNHKDGNKLNNKISNLEWCTPSENMKHAFKELGIVSNMKGKLGILCKNSIPVKVTDKEGNVYYHGSLAEAARVLNFSRGTASSVISGLRKDHKGFTFKYITRSTFNKISNNGPTLRKTTRQA